MCVGVGAWSRACDYVRVALRIQHATRMRHISYGPSVFTIIFDIILQTARFSGKDAEHKTLKLLIEIFLIVRRIQRDIFVNVKTSSRKIPGIFILINLEFFQQISEKEDLNIKFHQHLFSGDRIFYTDRQTDGWKDVTKLTVKSYPTTSLDRPLGFPEVEAPEFLDNQHMKVVRLSALRTGRLYPQEAFWYSFLLGTESTPGPQCDRKD
jgi:hypothetical protein